jgi:hypothetical protein
MENKANDLAVRDLSARISQLHSMVILANNLPFSRKEDLKNLTGSLMSNLGSRTLPAEVNVKLEKSITQLEGFFREEVQRQKDFGELKVKIWEPFT